MLKTNNSAGHVHSHNVTIVKQLLHAHKTNSYDPCKLVDLSFASKIEPRKCSVLQMAMDHSSSDCCNPLEIVKSVIERSNPDFMTTFLVEIVKAVKG